MQFLWKYVDDMVGKGLEWNIIAELIFYASASFVPLALPLAVLLSSIMTLGNYGENYELIAAKAAGISLLRFMASLVVAALLISVGAFVFSNNILPRANLKFAALLYDVRHQKPALNIREGVFYNEIEGFSIRVGKKEADNRTIYDILVYDHTSGQGNDQVLIARKGEMFMTADERFLVFRLYDGSQYTELKDETPERTFNHLITHFKVWEKYFDLSQFAMRRTDDKFWRNHYEMLNVRQLKAAMDSIRMEINQKITDYSRNMDQYYTFRNFNWDSLRLSGSGADSCWVLRFQSKSRQEQIDIINKAMSISRSVKSLAGVAQRDMQFRRKSLVKHELAYNRKFTFSVACLVLFFIGAPMGAIIRIGGLGMPLIIAVIFFVLFHVFTMSGQKIAESGVITAVQGSWLATVVLLPIGIFLTYKAMRDSSLFSMDWYYQLIKRWMRLKNNL
ncbi:MAG: hypothetical protein KatS3mg031_0527 [Chitinophagales bacterium]|nr:MAG: hypothetical protein KatS3mg031_0527 [Chitinophagales bacterium]